MAHYQNQIQRIKRKLVDAKKSDTGLNVFGANRHKYVINSPVPESEVNKFEESYSIQLPQCYRAFILEVGNGGIGFQNSAAGPFLGIYPFGEKATELIHDNTAKYLKNQCVLHPKITDDYWKSLTLNIDGNDAITDEQFENEIGNLWAGILPIGSQGCSYLHGIVLNGPFKGNVVNIDIDRQKPQFAFESNFLDWYERWLDEVISGELTKGGPSWFGYTKGGSEEQLLDGYNTYATSEDKNDFLSGLLNKSRLKEQTLNQIIELIDKSKSDKKVLVQIVCKTNYDRAKPYLSDLIETDLLSVFQFVYWYAKDKSIEWITAIKTNIDKIQDEETFRFCTYILREAKIDYGSLLTPFADNPNEAIRVTVFYTLGQLKNKGDYIDVFIKGLNSSSNRVIHSTLQALSDINDKRLLEHYKNIAIKFPKETDFILANLNHRLSEYGLTNKTILDYNVSKPK
jgi:hypothetical protein